MLLFAIIIRHNLSMAAHLHTAQSFPFN